MHNLISTVFKIVGGSLVIFMLLDTGMFILDTFSAISSVTTVASNMQVDISKYNGLPSQVMRDKYKQKLNEISDHSNTVASISSNIDNLANIKGYGEKQVLTIELSVNSFAYVMPKASVNGFVKEFLPAPVKLEASYDVPCLKYRKVNTTTTGGV